LVVNEEVVEELQKILEKTSQTGTWVSSELLPLVYDELRSLAERRIQDEKDPQSLQATALVHDAWLRLGNHEQLSWESRRHFFRAAAQAMRNILVDRARAKDSRKRGNRPVIIDIEKLDIADTSIDERVLLVDEMLTRLEADDPDSVRIITLKFFGGLTNREIAGMDGVTERTVERNLAFAKAKLFRMIRKETGEP
jgi:RNA polymerase sigma factor (TIGR02999 family)